MKTAVIYARYSSERQTEQSIEGQLRVCNEYAEKNNITVVKTYIDRAMTGTNDNRSDFQRMLKESAKQAWNMVLVYKLDRFSRNKYEMAMHKKTLRDNGIKLISCMENIPDTPEGIILESLLEGMAEYYSAELSQKVKRGMNESRRKGYFTGGFLIFGYRAENKRVIIHEEEAAILRKVFEACAAGKQIKSIISELNQRNILYRGKPFARNTVYNLLKNEKYIGIVRHGDEIFTNIYPPIIPKEIFETVKAKLDQNKYGKHPPDVFYLLKNKLKCGYCGHPVASDAGTSQNGQVMRYYKCTGKRKDKSCPCKSIRKELIENWVTETILKVFATPDAIANLADRIFELNKLKEKDNSVLTLLTNEYNRIKKSINNILNCMEQGIITESTKERLKELELKKSSLNEQIIIENTKKKTALTKNDIINYISLALRKNARSLINLLVKEVRVWNERLEIDLKYTDKNNPDGNDRRDFCLFTCDKSYAIDKHIINKKPTNHNVHIEIYI